MNAPGKSTPATKGLVRKPRPAGVLFTVDALARIFNRTPKAMYHVLGRCAASLSAPMYCQVKWPPDRKLYRVLAEKDLRVLRKLFPVYVKPKVHSGKKIAQR